MARNFYELQEELESSDNPYRNTVQMEHGSFVSPYQQFKQQYPELDAYGNKVARGGYFKDNIRRFAQAGRNARLEIQGQPPETEDTLLDFFGVGAMTAFHGSPHKFAKFSTKNIGTGEGAQAYGHGLYFAENPKVAGEYQKNLAGTVKKAGDEIYDITNPEHIASNALDVFKQRGYSPSKIASILRKDSDAISDKAADLIDNGFIGKKFTRDLEGSLYEVDIPDEHIKNFLDWDSPLSEQNKAVKEAFGYGMEGYAHKSKMNGGELYREMVSGTGGGDQASDLLNKLGIKGIKYFDGSSRSAGEGTRNLVVFDDKIVKTLSRNGKPVERSLDQYGSKSQRANQMGFKPKKWSHYSPNEFDEFDMSRSDLGPHFGTYAQAKYRADVFDGTDKNIKEFKLAVTNPLRLKDTGTFHADGIALQLEKKGILAKGEGRRIEMEIEKNWKLRKKYDPYVKQKMQEAGYDGVVYKNSHEGAGDSMVPFRANAIRSVDAKFDPSKKASANLLAGGVMGSIGLEAYLQNHLENGK